MNFLFDVINDIAGYTEKFYDEIQEKMSHDDLVQKYREERERCSSAGISYDKSDLLGNKHPHCVLAIEGL